MEITEELELNGKKIIFRNSKTGIEEFYYGDQCLSSKRSLLGGRHEFMLDGVLYSVKVKVTPDFKVHFSATADGKVIIKPKSTWHYWLFIIGGAVIFSTWKQLRKGSENPNAVPLFIGFFALGAAILGVGAYLAAKNKDG